MNLFFLSLRHYNTGSSRWSVGCKLVRWQINAKYHTGIKEVPYRAGFGQLPRVGISSLPLQKELIEQLATEAQLLAALGLDPEAVLEEAQVIMDKDGSIEQPSEVDKVRRCRLTSV